MANQEGYRPTAFISYRADGPDLEVAANLREALKNNQVSITAWRDKEDLTLGVEFAREMERGIASAKYFIQLLSAASLESPWCQRERLYAMQARRKILPVKLEATVNIPLEIIELQYLKMLHGVPDGLPSILRAMRVDVREPAKNPDPLSRDDRRMRALAKMCFFFAGVPVLPPVQVMAALVKPMAVASLETGEAVRIVEDVQRMNSERPFRDCREMGEELERQWDPPQ
jgi:hypothetical protein